jgi:carbonic anhydrase
MILGHTSCGAVTATLGGGGDGRYTKSVVDLILRSVKKAEKEILTDVDTVARIHAVRTAAMVRDSIPSAGKPASKGSCLVAAAFYDIETGTVEVLDMPG